MCVTSYNSIVVKKKKNLTIVSKNLFNKYCKVIGFKKNKDNRYLIKKTITFNALNIKIDIWIFKF